jgi:hypothetical protein
MAVNLEHEVMWRLRLFDSHYGDCCLLAYLYVTWVVNFKGRPRNVSISRSHTVTVACGVWRRAVSWVVTKLFDDKGSSFLEKVGEKKPRNRRCKKPEDHPIYYWTKFLQRFRIRFTQPNKKFSADLGSWSLSFWNLTWRHCVIYFSVSRQEELG